MKLTTWRNEQGKTQADVAHKLRINQQRYSRIENGVVPPRWLMKKIVALTDGAVQPNDFYDLPDPKPARKKTRTQGARA